MTYARKISFLFAWLLTSILPVFVTYADELHDAIGKDVIREGIINNDIYIAGERVDVRARVDGDVVAAGGEVHIANQVSGDVIAAGGRVDIRAQVLDDVRAAGGEVTINNRVNGDVIAAGGHIRLDQSASVGERAWLAGGEIEVDGHVGKELRAAGGDIVLAGLIDGDVTLIAESIQILPTARITGNLIYRSTHEADISSQAVITGNITHLPIEHGGERHGGGLSLLALLALFITAVMFYLIFPHFAHAALRTLGERPGASVGLGLAILFVTPPVIMLLMITVIGSVFGTVIFLLYTLMLIMGFLTGMLFFGNILLRLARQPQETTRGKRLLSLAAAFIILWLLGFLPVIGGLLCFIAMVLGTGALKLQMYRMYKAYRKVESGT